MQARMNRNLHYVRVDFKPLSQLVSRASLYLNYAKSILAPPDGFEPTTNRLSTYDWIWTKYPNSKVGIEPTYTLTYVYSSQWIILYQSTALPLSYEGSIAYHKPDTRGNKATITLLCPDKCSMSSRYSRTKRRGGLPLNSERFLCLLAHQDSNLEFQNQNLTCYHYTMGQSLNTC